MKKNISYTFGILFLIILLFASVLFLYGSTYALHTVETKKVSIKSDKLPTSFNNFKIAQLSDTYLSDKASLDNLNQAINIINDEHVDLVIFTGTLFNTHTSSDKQNYDKIDTLIENIKAKYGKFYTYSAYDQKELYYQNISKKIFEMSDMSYLNDSIKIFKDNYNTFFTLSSFSEIEDNHALDEQKVSDKTFNIYASNNPDLITKYNKNIDVFLAAKTLGNQINPKILHDIFPFNDKTLLTKYNHDQHVNHTQLYINNGLGVNHLALRVFSPAQVSIFTLHSSK